MTCTGGGQLRFRGTSLRSLHARQGEDMTDNGPISLRTHALAEPLVPVVFIAAPWLFGFSDVDDATVITIVLGVLVLATGLMTRWRMALVRVLPLAAHRAADLALGAFAIVSPFLFGFSDEGGPTRFLIIMGVTLLGVTMLTRWDARGEFATDGRHRTTPLGTR